MEVGHPNYVGVDTIQSEDWNRFDNIIDPNYLQNYKKQKGHEILVVVRIYGIRGGISHNELAERVRLDPKNLREHYMRDLIKNGLVKKGKGLQGKYFPRDEFYKDPLLNAYLFGDSYKRSLKKKKYWLALTNKSAILGFQKLDQPIFKSIDGKKTKLDTKMLRYDFTKYKQYYLPKFDSNSQTEKSLFEFSNRVGAFVVRALIEATNHRAYNSNTTEEEQNALAREYINKVVSTITPYLLPAFKDSVEEIPSIKYDLFEGKLEDLHRWTCPECMTQAESPDKKEIKDYAGKHQRETGHTKYSSIEGPINTVSPDRKEPDKFIFDEKITNKLTHAFDNIYPLLGYEFNKIIEDMPNNIESYKRYTERQYSKWEKQRTCDHDFKEPVMTLYGYYGQQCSKCHYIKRVKMPLSKVTKQNRQ